MIDFVTNRKLRLYQIENRLKQRYVYAQTGSDTDAYTMTVKSGKYSIFIMFS